MDKNEVILSEDELIGCCAISKTISYNQVKDILIEVCKHQHEHTLEQLKKPEELRGELSIILDKMLRKTTGIKSLVNLDESAKDILDLIWKHCEARVELEKRELINP